MWETVQWKACQAPLPADGDIHGIRAELSFLQRELLAWNAKLSQPRLTKNLAIRQWSDFDDGISAILEAREMLIGMRERWANETFKKQAKPTLAWGI